MLIESIAFIILSLFCAMIAVLIFSNHTQNIKMPDNKNYLDYAYIYFEKIISVKFTNLEKMLIIISTIIFYSFWSFIFGFIQEKDFKSVDGKFQIKFYNEPQLVKQKITYTPEDITLYTYTSVKNDIIYKVLYYKYPENNEITQVKDWYWDDPSKFALSGIKGNLKTKDLHTSNNVKFLRLTFEELRPQVYQTLTHSGIFNNIYYQIMAIYSLANSQNENIKPFFESFKIMN